MRFKVQTVNDTGIVILKLPVEQQCLLMEPCI